VASAEARVSTESGRAHAHAVSILAREAVALAREIQHGLPHPDPAVEHAAALARETAATLEVLCQGPACPSEAYREA
jgi:hypothetical protein